MGQNHDNSQALVTPICTTPQQTNISMPFNTIPSNNNMTVQETREVFYWQFIDLDNKNFQIHSWCLLLLLIIFSVLIFLTLLYLYIRWACHYHRWTTAAGTGDLPSEAGLPRQLGLDAETIDHFPVHLHQRSPSGDETQCSICLNCLIEREKVKVLPSCSHLFHSECIDEWLKTHSSCPLCRTFLGGSAVEPVAVV